MSPADLARVLRAAAYECDAISAEASAERGTWIDQRRSQLGPRRHCAAVKRRMADGKTDAAIVGRRHLLSQTAHAEELATPTTRERKLSVGDELRAELRLVGK
ncbi:MAG TPA: hypothetical protein VGI10_22665 [Polyangiaceae bacterium]|jgi:hypothetical protein